MLGVIVKLRPKAMRPNTVSAITSRFVSVRTVCIVRSAGTTDPSFERTTSIPRSEQLPYIVVCPTIETAAGGFPGMQITRKKC